MSIFPATIQAALAGEKVRASYLALLDFDGEPMRVWTGYGSLVTGGQTWSGIGDLASVDGIEQAVNGEAPQSTLVLTAANSDIVRLTRDEFKTKARDRLVQIYIQFHNDSDDAPLTAYDDPYAIHSAYMKAVSFDLRNDNTREITILCESLFSRRSRPVASQYTDRDQNQRFTGDLGFSFVPSLRHKTVTWPDF